jgi:hypothetical protein
MSAEQWAATDHNTSAGEEQGTVIVSAESIAAGGQSVFFVVVASVRRQGTSRNLDVVAIMCKRMPPYSGPEGQMASEVNEPRFKQAPKGHLQHSATLERRQGRARVCMEVSSACHCAASQPRVPLWVLHCCPHSRTDRAVWGSASSS